MGMQRKKVRIIFACFILSLILILFNFALHCLAVNKYNNTSRSYTSKEENDSNIEVKLYPRGQKTDSWVKEDVLEDELIYGQIYEVEITNKSGFTCDSWSLRLNIDRDCFINNAWNGTVCIHRFIDGEWVSQTLNLLNFNEEDITLPKSVITSTLFIPLCKGDYVEYFPSTDETYDELPITSSKKQGGGCKIGFILYNYTQDEIYEDYSLTYTLHKGYFSGSEATIFLVLMPIWFFLFLLYILYLVLTHIYEKRLKVKDAIIDESIEVFSSFVDAKDPYTKGHSDRVANLSVLIAKKLGMNERKQRDIYYIAKLHDIGKCYVPDEILKKKGRLTEEEFDEIKKHTTYGYKMLAHFSSVKDIADGAHFHHERYDGGGYPEGLKGEQIPLIARIICLADSFDAMNSNRCYRKHLSKERIKEEIEQNKGSQFDPKLADIFLEILKEKDDLFKNE